MRIGFILFIAFFVNCVAFAQVDKADMSGFQQRSEQLEVIANNLREKDVDLIALRDSLRDLQRDAEQQSAPLRAQLEAASSDLERLGPAPEEGGPQEAASIARERDRLNTEISRLNGILRKSDINMAEADRLMKEIASLRREQFSSSVFARSGSILSPQIWQDAFAQAVTDFSRGKQQFVNFQTRMAEQGKGWTPLLILGGAFLLAFAFFIPIRRQLQKTIAHRLEGVEVLRWRKVLVLAVFTIARFLPGLVGGYIIYEALRSMGFIPQEGEALARTIWLGFVALSMVDAAISGLIAPNAPKWRIAELADAQVFRLRTLLFVSSFTIVAERVLMESLQLAGATDSVVTLVKAVTTIILSVTLFMLSRPSNWHKHPVEDNPDEVKVIEATSYWSHVRLLGSLIAGVSIVAACIGYVDLGHYLTTRTFFLVALAAVVWVLRSILHEVVRLFDKRFTLPNENESKEANSGHENLLFYWIGFAVDFVAILAFIPPALLLLGADWADVRDGIMDAFIGFKIGNVNFSVLKIVTAIGVFLLILSLTRFVQKTAEVRVFPKSRIDVGVQNSLKTLIGYIGLVFAFLTGVSAFGFNLSNLAIIAGALSVGIGFGLQSIVSNFVSGLILLFERPIKVGDWIVTASGEGFVKKISVRSTEIETFDRASVIVPNSELISGAVTNWTHKDKIGRMVINVGVSYDADPEEVLVLLEAVAKENTQVLKYPAPFVYFSDFADSSLNFELRCFTSDVKQGIMIRSNLRVAIFKKLKEAGISIPFPQRDVHIISNKED
ncbi:DUF3772 domain-containing protein [Hirschia litorea]|uniref:DUF3772 domain-containing protein n=1 Tax=Hirschia litorea TaxID=1199156 RepID=A0ABW2IG92_9PROT